MFTGIYVDPLALRTKDIDIIDIAHALSNQCRFSGHVSKFYSVAQHSVSVSNRILKLTDDRQQALWGLLHDASEAYLVDMPRPLKHETEFGVIYRKYEAEAMETIAFRFNLPLSAPASVHEADDVLLVTEIRDLMPKPFRPWEGAPEPRQRPVAPCSPANAERMFLKRFDALTEAA